MGTVDAVARRLPIIIVFMAAVFIALCLSDDGTLLGDSWGPCRLILDALRSKGKQEEETFDGGSTANAAARAAGVAAVDADVACPPGTAAPLPLAPPGLATISPVHFQKGLTKNPVAKLRYLENDPPDPQRLSLLLQWRNREDLLLACRTRRNHCPKVGGKPVQGGPVPLSSSTAAPYPPPPCKASTA
jgi:hypothetical protein